MRKAEPNCDLRRIPAAFPYLRVFIQGPPEHAEDDFFQRHPRMEQGHRAKIFAPFDALDGYSELIDEKNRLREEAAEKAEPGNIILPWDDP